MFGMFDYQVLLTVRRLILESQSAKDPEDALESALLEAAEYGVTYTAATQTLERAVHDPARPTTLAMPADTPETAEMLEREMARHRAEYVATQPIREAVAAWCARQGRALRQLLPSEDRTQVVAQITHRLPSGVYVNAVLEWDGGKNVVLEEGALSREAAMPAPGSLFLAASEAKFEREQEALAMWARQAQPAQGALITIGVGR